MGVGISVALIINLLTQWEIGKKNQLNQLIKNLLIQIGSSKGKSKIVKEEILIKKSSIKNPLIQWKFQEEN